MNKLNYELHPNISSIKRLIFWIGLFCGLLSIGGLLCVVWSPRGIDTQALKIFIGIPFCYIFLPVLLISFSYKIKINHDKIIFYMFFFPVKIIPLKKINKVNFEKIASNGQPCAITVCYSNEKYIYPIRLFDLDEIKQLLADLNDISCRKIAHSESINDPFFAIPEKKALKNFIRYIIIIFLILLFLLIFNK